MSEPVLLIGDIGGTHARFALAVAGDGGFAGEMEYACADFTSPSQAIGEYLALRGAGKPSVICLAVAGPVVRQQVKFTNSPWTISRDELQRQFAANECRLLNDFEAAALSVPLLADDELAEIGPPLPRLAEEGDFSVAVMGPGTGLGVAGLMRRAGRYHTVTGEGGHKGFAAETDDQLEVLKRLRNRFGRVSDERLLSGPGLENIYRAICEIHGRDSGGTGVAEIFDRGRSAQDSCAVESLGLFYRVLGQAAGDLVLTLGAYDGVYLAGGILKRYPELLEKSAFRSGFEDKGRHRPLMQRVASRLILHSQAGLLGASHAARKLYRQFPG